jgi:excisionase family DNA binding protein
MKHTTIHGEVVEYDASHAEQAYLAEARALAEDPNVELDTLIEFIWSKDNPTLDSTLVPGRGMVTKAVIERPIYRVYNDLFLAKRIQCGLLDVQKTTAKYTLTVAEAAEQVGVVESSIRTACKAGRILAIKDGDSWRIDPDSLSRYRARKKS